MVLEKHLEKGFLEIMTSDLLGFYMKLQITVLCMNASGVVNLKERSWSRGRGLNRDCHGLLYVSLYF